MKRPVINENLCKGCGICVEACPMKVLAVSSSKINLRGLNVAEVVNPGKCIGCRMCEIVCPDFAIAVIEERVVTNAHT